MSIVIGLTGYAGSGKDCAAQGLIERGWQRVSFADGVRELALKINPIIDAAFDDEAYRLGRTVEKFGWDRAKGETEVRQLLQNIGTGVRDVLGEDAWVQVAGDKIDEAIQAGKNVVITDVRFQNEADALFQIGMDYCASHLSACEVAIVRITRPGVGPVNGHISETAIDAIVPDDTIVNDGTPEELQAKLVTIAESLERTTVKDY